MSSLLYRVDMETECFDSDFFDSDLTSACTTVMKMAGHPDYSKCRRLTYSELEKN